jgi:hypothetical protein
MEIFRRSSQGITWDQIYMDHFSDNSSPKISKMNESFRHSVYYKKPKDKIYYVEVNSELIFLYILRVSKFGTIEKERES